MICRPATVKDAEGIAKCQIKTWQHAYKGIVAQDYLDHQPSLLSEKIEKWTNCIIDREQGACFVVEIDGEIVGFADCGVHRSQDRKTIEDQNKAELYAIYVDPDVKNKGLGTALYKKCEEWAKTHTFEDMYVWVLRDNKLARAFYEKVNQTASLSGEKEIEIAGQKLQEIRYHWKIG